jgi:L-rhamnose mutarotase
MYIPASNQSENIMFYVIGYSDTRGEFSPKGATKSKVRANKFKDDLQKQLFKNARQWAEVKEVKSI